MKELSKIQEYLDAHYHFRYNEITSKVEFCSTQDTNYQPMTDRDIHSLIIGLAQAGINVKLQDLRIIVNSNLVTSYNPIKDYFNALPTQTGKENIKQLLATIDTHDNEFFEWAFTKWLVAWVACMLEDEVTNHQCIILAGNQGIGKSTWVENLMPQDLMPYYFAGNIKLGNKDTLGFLSDKCLINLDELASMTYSNVTELKELVTKSKISFRKAYGYHTENFIRRASFIGSVNGTEFLYDLTGNRRFLSFEVNSFENYGTHNIDMNLVLTEAFYLYKTGFQYWFDAEDQKKVEKNNEQFLVKSLEEIKLLENYSKAPNVTEQTATFRYALEIKTGQLNNEEFIRSNSRETIEAIKNGVSKLKELTDKYYCPEHLLTLEIFEKIIYKKPNQGELVKLGKILNKYGFKSKRTNKGTEYELYRIEKGKVS
jgi:predicted P-loop ATPase